MLNDWVSRCLRDPELAYLKKNLSLNFLIKIGNSNYLWTLRDDRIEVKTSYTIDDVWSFTIVIPQEAWTKFVSKNPPPFYTTLQAMMARVPGVSVEGDRLAWAQAATAVERICALAREEVSANPIGRSGQQFSPETIRGHYVKMSDENDEYIVYYEESGVGHPLIFLHTAGSDSRQYKYLLGNMELQKNWHMYAFDLPYHGRSEPPNGWWTKPYQLTTQLYTDWILAFMKSVDLYHRKPVILGCSMGGAIVLYLAATHGDLFKAAISVEGGFGTTGRYVTWTNHPKVDGGRFLQSWVAGLMAPNSPEYDRRLALWEYSQGAPGVYQGDIYFYSQEWPEISKSIGKAKCPLWILTGEYDYSCTPEMSQEAANRMGGQFIKMEGIGHFPMSENAELFISYLNSVLNEVAQL